MKRILNKSQVNKIKSQEAGQFLEQVRATAINENGVFDSAAADELTSDALSRDTGMPSTLKAVMDEINTEDRPSIIKAILDGAADYEQRNGVEAPDDLIEYAMFMGYGLTEEGKKGILDSASSVHSDTLSLQPNRAVIAIQMAISEGVPFAHYLPADINSNEAKLAIFTHLAGSNYGQYAQNGLMDGVANGDTYISSARVHATANAAGAHTGQLTSIQATAETCQAVGGNAVAVNLLRGRTNVYVNGILAAREISQTGSGVSTVSGSITIAGVTSQIGGTINTDTGAIALTSTPALANGVPVHVEGFIDYERQPALIPSIITSVEPFKLYAKPWRAFTQTTPDGRSQMVNELGVDPISEALVAIQMQYANERHYELLWKAKRLAVNSTDTFNMDWTVQGAQKTRSQILQDFSAKLGALSQAMTVNTLGFGITHLYVGAYFKSQLEGLPTELFQPSGVKERAGIYRVGRLFGKYDVCYTPKVVTDSASASQVLCIGRAPDVARNPFVLGDSVPPSFITLGVGTDLKAGTGYYGRGFNEVNPYQPSALGCALLNITNMNV